jgi:hypothetical protein
VRRRVSDQDPIGERGDKAVALLACLLVRG